MTDCETDPDNHPSQSPKMAVCLVASPEDIVIVYEEECVKCTDTKLNVLKRYPLAVGLPERRQEITAFKRASDYPIEWARQAYRKRVADLEAEAVKHNRTPVIPPFPEHLWLEPRQVRVRCECGAIRRSCNG